MLLTLCVLACEHRGTPPMRADVTVMAPNEDKLSEIRSEMTEMMENYHALRVQLVSQRAAGCKHRGEKYHLAAGSAVKVKERLVSYFMTWALAVYYIKRLIPPTAERQILGPRKSGPTHLVVQDE